jgi:hypothetical protein
MSAKRDYRWTLHRGALATDALYDLLEAFPESQRSREMVQLAWLGLRAHQHYRLPTSFLNEKTSGEAMRLRFSLDNDNPAERELLAEMAPFNRPQGRSRVLSLAWLGACILTGSACLAPPRPGLSPGFEQAAPRKPEAPAPLRSRPALAPDASQAPVIPQSFGVLEHFDVADALATF